MEGQPTQPPTAFSLSFRDARVAANTPDGKWFVSSPNMTFVPLPVMGAHRVRMRADGRFGLQDPTQWPQNFSRKSQWLVAIPRRPSDENDPLQPIWMNVTFQDFMLAKSLISNLGILSSERRDQLGRLVHDMGKKARSAHMADPVRYGGLLSSLCCQMEEAFTRLSLPSTFRDMVQQVTCVQRHYLYTSAVLTWYGDLYTLDAFSSHSVRPELMGAFSTDARDITMLFNLGVPVWYLRLHIQIVHGDIVQSVVRFTEPSEIIIENGDFGQLIYDGNVGSEEFFQAIAGAGKNYLDVEGAPLPAEQTQLSTNRSTGVVRVSHAMHVHPPPRAGNTSLVSRHSFHSSRSHPYVLRGIKNPIVSGGRDKFQAPQHPWITGAIPVWVEALARVNQQKPCPTGMDLWGYRIPEAFLVISPEDKRRRLSYLLNWLRIRSSLAYVLSHPAHQDSVPPFSPQMWRTYLRFGPTPSSESNSGSGTRTQTDKNIVSASFRSIFGNLTSSETIPLFFDQEVPTSVEDIPLQLAQQITWDLHEMGFRVELRQLDRVLYTPTSEEDARDHANQIAAIFPDGVFFPYAALPKHPSGLAAVQVKHRVRSLEALRAVMVTWSTAPQDIKSIPVLSTQVSDTYVEFMERKMVSFYVQQFFEASGRAAIIPYRFPISN